MFHTIFSAATAYLSTNIDYLVLLMAFFSQSQSRYKFRDVFLGDVMGSFVLVMGSLTLGVILHIIPEEWILGFLGIIPLYFGCKLILQGMSDDDQVQADFSGFKLSRYVALITITSCSADNIGIYTPLFASMQVASEVYLTLLTFAVMLVLVFLTAIILFHIPMITTIIEKYGRWVSAIIYLGLGSYIMYESGTISHLLLLLH